MDIDTIKDRTHIGIKINGYKINMLRFDESLVIIAKIEKNLNKILGAMKQTMEKNLNMKMNAKKSKFLVCSKNNNIKTRIKLY